MNCVFRCSTPRLSVVLKQAQAYHFAPGVSITPRRIVIEYLALDLLSTWYPEYFPHPLFLNRALHTLGMEAITEDARLLESDLLLGTVDTGVAEIVGSIFANLHSKTRALPHLRVAFANTATLMAKIYCQCLCASRSPRIQSEIVRQLWPALYRRSCLVHGDICPKNILVERGRPIFIDLEEVHFGNPALDVGYLLAHYLLFKLAAPASEADLYDAAIATFLHHYLSFSEFPISLDFEHDVVFFVGVFLLSRVDGVARTEWRISARASMLVRALASEVILKAPTSLAQLLDRVGSLSSIREVKR
jgi:5-methylthioribose kinase